MAVILTLWLILFVFEVALFSSYTLITYFASRRPDQLGESQDLPSMTLIIPMYNEEQVIAEKVRNSAILDYPPEKLEILFLDDHSTDESVARTEEAIEKSGLNARVVRSQGGKGKARALNWLFHQLNRDVTVVSDADALLEESALRKIARHYADPLTGGVTGKIVIFADRDRSSKAQEEAYRQFYDIWRQGESNIASVSVCNGPLMSFRTSLLHRVRIDPDAYADDSDLLFKIINLGFRVRYDPDAVVYERVPLSLKGRIIQKMKRINGLRKVYLSNLSLLGRGRFGRLIYPYALLTHLVSPVIVLILILLYPFVLVADLPYALLLVVFVIPGIGRTVRSFVLTQAIMNFSFLVPTGGSWEAIEDARYDVQDGV
jgi:biofilm PGA synthesis N-glycosyltransferase PgaC